MAVADDAAQIDALFHPDDVTIVRDEDGRIIGYRVRLSHDLSATEGTGSCEQ